MRLEDSELYQLIGTLIKWIPAAMIIIALIIAVIIMVRRTIKKGKKEHAAGKTVSARVVSKREKKRRDPNISRYDQYLATLVTHFYYIKFETNSYQQFELTVPAEVYHELVEDQKGTLTYEGARFIDFIPGEW